MSADHSGSSTSQASAPSRARRRGDALIYLGLVGEQGATWRDLADYLDVHHGAASSVLSVLHREGKVCAGARSAPVLPVPRGAAA